MEKAYLIYSFASFLAYIILQVMNNQIKWVALGFGIVMLILGLTSKTKIEVEDK